VNQLRVLIKQVARSRRGLTRACCQCFEEICHQRLPLRSGLLARAAPGHGFAELLDMNDGEACQECNDAVRAPKGAPKSFAVSHT